MFKQIVIAVLLFATLTGCQSNSALKYNQSILAKEKSLVPEINSTESKVKSFLASANYDSIAIAGSNMEKIVQQKIDEIKSMPVPKAKEADNFKMAAIRYFEYIKSMYTGYKELGNATTEEEREAVMEKLFKIDEGKQAVINDMQAVQRRFASENGFKIK